MTVHTGNSLGSLAAEAQTGLADATLINQTLQLLNGQNSMNNTGLEIISDATKNLVNAALGKGLNLDTLA